jgi:hypothetical protein
MNFLWFIMFSLSMIWYEWCIHVKYLPSKTPLLNSRVPRKGFCWHNHFPFPPATTYICLLNTNLSSTFSIFDLTSVIKFSNNSFLSYGTFCKSKLKVKVKLSLQRLGQSLRLEEIKVPGIARQSVYKGCKVVSLTHSPPLPWYPSLLEFESTPDT